MSPKVQPVRVEHLADLLEKYVKVISRIAALLKAIHAMSDEHSDAAHLAAVGQGLARDMSDLSTFFMEQVQMYGVLEGVERGTVFLNRKVAAVGSDQGTSTVEFLRGSMENCLGLAREARTAKMRAYHKGCADAFQVAIAALEDEA